MAKILPKPLQVRQSINKKFRKTLWTPFVSAVKRYKLIEPGDRIAVCLSGGKDSAVLAVLMDMLRQYSDFPFELEFIVMDPGYLPKNRKMIEENAEILNIRPKIFDTDIFNSVAGVKDSPCYLCARMRRGYLYEFAANLGCNKIALGHHMDDVIETTVMAMFYGAQLQAMPPKLRSTNHPGMQLIRPLFYVAESDICAWRDHNELEFLRCACRFTEMAEQDEKASKRLETKNLIEALRKENPLIRQNILNSIHNVCIDTFCGYKTNGVKYEFCEIFDGAENPADGENNKMD